MDRLYHNRNSAAALSLACLSLVPFLVFFPVLRSEYVAYDDELLIVDNVKAQGLTWEHVKEAFTSYDPELYIPLTILTEQIEYSLVGEWSSAVSHGVNLVLHLMNTVLVFWLVRLVLGACHTSTGLTMTPTWIAFFSALFWSVHPLNVEAVAWAAARKDLLSGFFFLGSLCAYLRWKMEDGRWKNPYTSFFFLTSFFSFLLGLLAKVSIAPLPLVLLMIDWWQGREMRGPALREKVPYFFLAAVFIIIALLGKKAQVHAMGATLLAPFVAIPFYLQKLFIPTGLSILYPFTDELSLAHPRVLLGLAVLGGLTWIAWWSLRWTRSVACAFGIFLLLLTPSFLNVARRGDAGMIDLYIASDRYMYLAMLGPLVLLGAILASRWWLPYALLPVLGLFAFLTVRQVGVWHDSEALFRNVLDQHQASHIAANNLAGFLARKGEREEAMRLYQQSIHIRENPRALFNLGRLLLNEKRFAEALPLFERYVVMKPRDGFGQMQLGGLYLFQNDLVSARPHLEKAVESDPNLTEAHYLLGVAYERLGDRTKAKREFQETLRLEPNHSHARGKLGKSPIQ